MRRGDIRRAFRWQVGARLEEFQIDELIRRGGVSEVYRARVSTSKMPWGGLRAIKIGKRNCEMQISG
jgi:hypothetical protein